MRNLLRRTPTHIILVCVLVAIVDITLFVTWFTDFDEPLLIPSNDFRRLVHTHSPSVRRNHRSQSSAQCVCDPLKFPSSLVKCMIGPHGEQQTRIKNQGHQGTILFKCARLEGGKRCQCCDCGSERLHIRFPPAVIREASGPFCATCETPMPSSSPLAPAVFAKGHAHQMLFALPLGLQHGYTSFSMNITIEGNFKRTADNDPLVGFMDDTHQAWLVQRGDNGVWLTLGQVVHESNKTIIVADHIDHRVHGSRADKFRIRLTQINQGKGLTSVMVEHDASHHDSADKAVYKQKGWLTSGHAKSLHLVAFRDDHDEIYEFTDIRVDYTKEY